LWPSFKWAIKKNIPNVFTMGNLVLGVLALLYIVEGNYELGISLVFISMVLDGLDGKLALKLKVTSELGKQLDSLCDLVSFGVVPAVILYQFSFYQFGAAGLLITVLFPMAGAYRLARFNLTKSSGSDFIGLPITMAGGALAALALHGDLYHTWIPPLYAVILTYLMVSRVRYPAIKKGQRNLKSLTVAVFYLGIVGYIVFVLFMREMVLYLLISYVSFGLLYNLVRLKRDENVEQSLVSVLLLGDKGDLPPHS